MSPDDPRLAASLAVLGSVCSARARYLEAEGFYRRAISIREKALGNQNPETAMLWNRLAKLYVIEKQYHKAEPLLTKVIEV